MLTDTADNRNQALRLLQSGHLDEARRTYEMLLSASPADADLLGRLAQVTLLQDRPADAEALLRRSLGVYSDPRIRLRNLFGLGVLLRKSGREDEMLRLVAAEAPEWPEAMPAGEAVRTMVLWLVDALIGAGETGKARRLLDRALPDRSGDADALALEGGLALREGDSDRALRIVGALDRLGEDEAARALVYRVMRRWSGFLDPPRASHRATILVFNPAATTASKLPTELRNLHFHANYAGQVGITMQDDYRFVSVLADLLDSSFHEQLPPADLVLNNCVNAERLTASDTLGALREQIDAIGLPVINHPDQAVQTARDNYARLFAGVPNLKVPNIERYRVDPDSISGVVADIGGRFAYPLIVRKPSAQSSSNSLFARDERKTALLIHDPAALKEHLERSGWTDFYAIEFVNLKRGDGYYRKLRAAMMGGQVIVHQASIYRDWMVSGWRARPEGIAFYRANPRTIRECNGIIDDPEAHLGAAALRTLDAVRERIPLDVCGVDFDVDREGRVVLFEATAAMTFGGNRSQHPADIRLPGEPLLRIEEAFCGLVAQRLAERPDPTA